MRVSLTPYPEEANGALCVLTNDKIQVGIVGTDTVTEMDVGGYILIHKTDFKQLITELKNRK